jgi:hypothetical protein
MPMPLDPDMWDRIDARRGQSHRAIAAAEGVAPSTVQKYLNMPRPGAEQTGGAGDQVPPEGNRFEERADGTAAQTVVTPEVVRTYADAIRVAGVDLSVWFVDSWEATQWTVGMKVKVGDGKQETRREQQYRVKLKLRRIVPRAIRDALEIVFARLKDAAPRWPKVEKERESSAEPFMAVFGLFDVHFGKLCWDKESGDKYDLKIAEVLFRNAVVDLIAESRHRRISRVLLPFGNDWFHVDNASNTTTRGTPQDVDGRFSKVLATGKLAAIWAVEQLAAIAPVQVEFVPGNHDRRLSEVLCSVIEARFHHTDRVTVNLDPVTRKYVRFGTNLIGLTHGDLVKPEKLPALMPVDNPREWAETTTREWITGHGHRSQKWTTLDTDTQQGTVVRMLRALTRTDLYHFDNGFCGQSPAAEVYWYGRDRGYAGHAVVPARGA